MTIPLLKITNGFPEMPEPMLIDRATAIYEAMSENSISFPTPNPSMPDLLDVLNAFKKAVADLKEGGTKWQVEQKNNTKDQLVDMLHLLGYYVLYTAQGNRVIALQSGFTIAKPLTPVIITKPDAPKLQTGEQKGWIQVSVKPQRGVRAYLHQYTTDPEQKEESWMSMNCTTAKCILKGLTPGENYFVRVGVIGPKEQVFYSDVNSRIAA